MAEAVSRIVKSTQEQATASWITYLNQIRLDTLLERLHQQDLNLKDALWELAKLKAFIGDPAHILGSEATKHGEIAEHMQVNISNARRAVQGLSKEYTFEGVGRTAPVDYLKNGQQVQSKFQNGLKNTFFRTNGLADHLEKYPDFVKNGGAYDIPKDQYWQMVDLLEKYRNSPSQLQNGEYTLAKELDEYLKTNGLEIGKDIKPAVIDYSEAQRNVADKTVNREEESIKKEDEKQRKEAYDASKPTLKEGFKAAGVSAATEGGVSFCMSVAKKRKEKKFSEFTGDDWKEVGVDTTKGTVKGGIRGGSIYILTNFTATPANVASAYVTAAFGVAEQVRALEAGKVSKEDFVINCETVCLDVTVSALASLAGQIIIPIPVLGAVIGNISGEFIYELCQKEGTRQSQKIITAYNQEMSQLNKQLDIQLLQIIMELQKVLKRFEDFEKLAFSMDVNIAFNGSVNLAKELGVNEKQILETKSQIDNYFLG